MKNYDVGVYTHSDDCVSFSGGTEDVKEISEYDAPDMWLDLYLGDTHVGQVRAHYHDGDWEVQLKGKQEKFQVRPSAEEAKRIADRKAAAEAHEAAENAEKEKLEKQPQCPVCGNWRDLDYDEKKSSEENQILRVRCYTCNPQISIITRSVGMRSYDITCKNRGPAGPPNKLCNEFLYEASIKLGGNAKDYCRLPKKHEGLHEGYYEVLSETERVR